MEASVEAADIWSILAVSQRLQQWRCHRWWRLWWHHWWGHRLKNCHQWGIFTGEINLDTLFCGSSASEITPGGDILGLRYLINWNSVIFSSITYNDHIWRLILNNDGVWDQSEHILTTSPVVTGDRSFTGEAHRAISAGNPSRVTRWGTWRLRIKSAQSMERPSKTGWTCWPTRRRSTMPHWDPGYMVNFFRDFGYMAQCYWH